MDDVKKKEEIILKEENEEDNSDGALTSYNILNFSKCYNINLIQGEIHEYAKNINIYGEFLLGKCIILETSIPFKENVLICPMYEVNEKNKYKNGITIGKLLIKGKQNEYLAAIEEIRFISKKRFTEYKIQKEKLNELSLRKICSIFYEYNQLIKQTIIKDKEYNKRLTC